MLLVYYRLLLAPHYHFISIIIIYYYLISIIGCYWLLGLSLALIPTCAIVHIYRLLCMPSRALLALPGAAVGVLATARGASQVSATGYKGRREAAAWRRAHNLLTRSSHGNGNAVDNARPVVAVAVVTITVAGNDTRPLTCSSSHHRVCSKRTVPQMAAAARAAGLCVWTQFWARVRGAATWRAVGSVGAKFAAPRELRLVRGAVAE